MSKDELDFDPSIPEDERRFYLKAYPNVNHVRERKVHCTICKMHIGTAPSNESIIRMHPILRVTHCKKCHEFYNSGEFSKGEDGSELYCRWCGQGGEVYCCSNCPYVFCKSCIISNLSRGVVADIEQNENWSCFNCAPKMLWPLRAQHWALIKFIDKQKKAILSSNLTDSEIKIQMTKDRSLCCKIKKVGGGYGTDSSDSSDISLSRLKKKAGDKRSRKSLSKEDLTGGASPAQAKKLKNNDNDVVCTPDVLSMLEPECTLTVPAKSPANAQPSTPTPKIMSIQAAPPKRPTPTPPLILRNVQQPLLRPAPPTQVLKKTVVGPRMPAGGQSSDFTTPVYHTINGYRIDLNSAAQQETVRLPNGKLIQVKRQGTGPQQVTTVQNAPNQHSTPTRVIHNIATPSVSPITSGPSQQVVHSSGGHIIRAQLQAPRPVVMPTMQNNSLGSQYQQQLQQQQQQQQPTQPHYQQITIRQPQIATIRYQGNTAPQMSNMIPNGTMQILNGTQVTTTGSGQQLPSIRPVPTFIKQLFPNTPLGQSRTQLQNQIFNAMEICQHLMGKLQTLTNSNAYKTAKSMTDVKELYIHLSYLLTYAIGRFKGLQDNCLADMRDLGFTNDANSLENGQLAAGMDMVRNGMITDFSQVDLESFHSLIVQNMNLMKTAVAADSSTNSEVAETPGVSSKKLTHLNHNRMILAQNGNPVRTELDATSEANDDDPECLLVALDNEQSPEQIILESEDEEEPEEDCLLVELADRISDKYTPPASPTVEEKFNEQEEEKVLHSGLLTQYGIGDDEEYESDTKNDYRLLSVNFTKEQDLRLIKILKDFPLLWYPKKTNTKQPVMNVLWKKVNRLMPKGLNNRERWRTMKKSYKKSQNLYRYADELEFLKDLKSLPKKNVQAKDVKISIKGKKFNINKSALEAMNTKAVKDIKISTKDKKFNINKSALEVTKAPKLEKSSKVKREEYRNVKSKSRSFIEDVKPQTKVETKLNKTTVDPRTTDPFQDYDFIVKLIEVVEKYPTLWHPQSDAVIRRLPQPKVWDEVYKEINNPKYTVKDLKLKWKILRCCFSRHNVSAAPFRDMLHFLKKKK
ncbi:uncharacterized protein LOC129917933 isoform X2 [Episyrphus balteatus]|uniref:uncharacterized protein LOC129917933 isoform X2 n=1 Tax=Episyrphus balteatus TaxID=286459 RepID=UPI0024855EE2|nr:uncharacterized protein LOC129917933 isoform X2 [Episyrphus balteatus]